LHSSGDKDLYTSKIRLNMSFLFVWTVMACL
jgi:hypothetical protein